MTKALPFTKAAVKRAVDAVRKAGLHVTAVSVDKDGKVSVSCGDSAPPSVQPDSTTDTSNLPIDKWEDA